MSVDWASYCEAGAPTPNASEGWGPLSQLRDLDFTPCFHDTVVRNAPVLLLILLGFPQFIYDVVYRPVLAVGWPRWLTVKMVMAMLYLGTSVVTLVFTLRSSMHELVAASAAVFAALFATLVLFHHHRRAGIPSDPLIMFWIFSFLATGLRVRTTFQIAITKGGIESVTPADWILLVQAVLALVLGILEEIADYSPSSWRAKRLNEDFDGDDDDHNTCTEERSGLFSRIYLGWMGNLMFRGYRKPLTQDDLWTMSRANSAKVASEAFENAWALEVEKPKPSLFKALVRAYGREFFIGSIDQFIYVAITVFQPLLLGELVRHLSSLEDRPVCDKDNDFAEPEYMGYVYAFGMFAASLVASACNQKQLHISQTVGMKLRSSLVTAIYRKSLRLSNQARKESQSGEVLNHMSLDAQKVLDSCFTLNALWAAPLQVIVTLYLLWSLFGPASLAGFGVIVFILPINAVLAGLASKQQKMAMKFRDERLKSLYELLSGIKILKLYAWETPWAGRVEKVREKEVNALAKVAGWNAIQYGIFGCTGILTVLATFGTYVAWQQGEGAKALDPPRAFAGFALLSVLQIPLIMLPLAVNATIQARIALSRILPFLLAEELDPRSVNWRTRSEAAPQDGALLRTTADGGEAISVQRATVTWGGSADAFVLGKLGNELTFRCKRSTLTAVTGTVGSGKSSLISSILGEMERVSGSISVKGRIAYVAQQAWLMNGTLRDNVVFGFPFDPRKYERTIEACALGPDIAMLPAGDQTEIGESGVNLSGGQKQRISLARAVYANADIYLLDDPLSAVDAHVGKHIFEHVISNQGLLREATRLFVTNSIQFLSQSEQILVLNEGCISESGSFQDLMNKPNGELRSLVEEFGNANDRDKAGAGAGNEADDTVGEVVSRIRSETGLVSARSIQRNTGSVRRRPSSPDIAASFGSQRGRSESQVSLLRNSINGEYSQASASGSFNRGRAKSGHDSIVSAPAADVDPVKDLREKGRLIQNEVAAEGKIGLKNYVRYFSALGVWIFVGTVMSFFMSQVFAVLGSIWLSKWTASNREECTNKESGYFVGGYAGFFVGQGIFLYLQNYFVFAIVGVRSGRALHNSLLKNIVRIPLAFFDVTPLGRIINRFDKDMNNVDEILPRSLTLFFRAVALTFTTITIISYGSVYFLIACVPLGLIYYMIQEYFLASSRQLNRLNAVTRSPVYAHFAETLSGLTTIRAYRRQQTFIHSNESKLDLNNRAFYPMFCCQRWLVTRLELLGACVVLFTSFYSVYGKGGLDSNVAGLIISSALTITISLNWMVQQRNESDINVVSVERIDEYSQLEKEAPHEIPENKPPADWPTAGEIQFNGYSTRYREGLDLVLKELRVNIHPGEKIGIVGRTGAGKSSLTVAMFRIVEAAAGSIIIDGVDISKIGLFDLRSRITIIPQDPVLFSGTVRDNLDPFHTKNDADLWNALEQVRLSAYVSKLTGGLDAAVIAAGENFSVGQRQLLCLARALLRKSRVLILDEATAAIDIETDELIQRTIRSEFKNSTVLTIAHRINTILDSDRILFLDQGQVCEFESPKVLLRNQGSKFYSLVKEANLLYEAEQLLKE